MVRMLVSMAACWVHMVAAALPGAYDSPVVVHVDTDGPPTHRVNPLYLGCHTDLGFTHQDYGFSSQMVFGESFEKPQPNCTYGEAANAWGFSPCLGCNATSTLEAAVVAPAMHGASSRRLSIGAPATHGATLAALYNRGLGNEGFFLEAGRPYEGYLFARCAAPVTLVVRLEDYTRPSSRGSVAASADWAVLAERRIDFACGASADEWVRVDFELTPRSGAACEGIAVGSDPDVACTRPTPELGHSCVRCAGQLSIGLAGVGAVGLDYVVLQPGAWGRLAGPDGPLPVRLSTASTLTKMGTKVLRVGGSFASVTAWPDGGGGTPPSTASGAYYQWQKWTGPPWRRPSVGAVWNAYQGTSYSLIGGWGCAGATAAHRHRHM